MSQSSPNLPTCGFSNILLVDLFLDKEDDICYATYILFNFVGFYWREIMMGGVEVDAWGYLKVNNFF